MTHHKHTDAFKVLGDGIIFQFLNVDVQNGKFIEHSESGIYLGFNSDSSAKSIRRAKVVAIGPKVYDITVGSVILIEPLMWTDGFKLHGEMFWKTAEEKVLAVEE